MSVVDDAGTQPRDTDHGRNLKERGVEGLIVSNAKRAILQPNQQFIEPGALVVDELYDMSRPGRHTIQYSE